MTLMGLFNLGKFTLHSGGTCSYKIDCDYLTAEDLEALALIGSSLVTFGSVTGIPRGGLRFATALEQYVTQGPVLIVDDVLTTGSSMMEAKRQYPDAVGLVIFSKKKPPDWVKAIFTMSD
jgi:orotate phosphoribosyltransferase